MRLRATCNGVAFMAFLLAQAGAFVPSAFTARRGVSQQSRQSFLSPARAFAPKVLRVSGLPEVERPFVELQDEQPPMEEVSWGSTESVLCKSPY